MIENYTTEAATTMPQPSDSNRNKRLTRTTHAQPDDA